MTSSRVTVEPFLMILSFECELPYLTIRMPLMILFLESAGYSNNSTMLYTLVIYSLRGVEFCFPFIKSSKIERIFLVLGLNSSSRSVQYVSRLYSMGTALYLILLGTMYFVLPVAYHLPIRWSPSSPTQYMRYSHLSGFAAFLAIFILLCKLRNIVYVWWSLVNLVLDYFQ